jgi:ABC-2 type transport system permease protein
MAIIGLSMVLFDLPMRGSWALLLTAVALFVVSALALGLLVSTVAETQQVALQVALLATFLPTLILSGFIFPIMSMPTPLQVISTVVPAKYFVTALRGIVLKGVGTDVIGPQMVALLVFAAALLALASLRLKREWA